MIVTFGKFKVRVSLSLVGIAAPYPVGICVAVGSLPKSISPQRITCVVRYIVAKSSGKY
jgi:hypothetical protein